MKKIPTYKISATPSKGDKVTLGWYETAFVQNPAIITKGLAFNAIKEEALKIHFSDSVKMRIAAPIMIPNIEIPRKDEETGDLYNVVFPSEVVEELHGKFMQGLNNENIFNLEHNEKAKVPAYFLEMWIVDEPLKDKSFSTYGVKVPKGTLFGVAQITDKDYYNSLVENEQLGFSIEAFLNLKLNKLNNTIMNKLPNGEFSIDGKNFSVLDGVITEKLSEEKTPEQIAEEKKAEEEKLAAEKITEEERKAEEEKLEADKKAEEEAEAEKLTEEEEAGKTPEETEEEKLTEEGEPIEKQITDIVNPMFEAFKEDILEILAEFKNSNEDSNEDKEEAEPQLMTAQTKFSQLTNFLKK